ncbi:MAG: DUF11 domain-containing protein [Acidobacteria bacterium]|nr:DUF11 domain-containing protein [Acidobacteriota bacterium]
MRTTHTLKTHMRRALLAALAFVLLATLTFAFTPLSAVMAKLGVAKPVKQLLTPAARTTAKSPVKEEAKQAAVNSVAVAANASAAMFDAPITKIASPPDGQKVSGGQLITYTVTVTNDAAVDETFGTNRLRVRDGIPASTTYEPGSVTILQQPGNGSSAWTCSFDGGNNRVECLTATGGILREFAVFKFEFKVRVNSSATGAIVSNQAQFFNEQQTGATPTNLSNTTNHPVAQADLGITKTTSNTNPVNGGAAFSYTLTVTNNGPGAAYGVVVTDPLPAGIVFQNVAVVNTNTGGLGLTCSGPPVGTNGVVSCTGNFPVPSGGTPTSTITIVAQAASNQAGGNRTNTATVSSNTQEPTPNVFPNSANVPQILQNNASLSITKTGTAAVCAGENITYTISVRNSGDSDALNVRVTDVLPANTTFVSVNGAGAFAGNCGFNPGNNTVTCTAPVLDISPLHNIQLVVKTTPNTPIGNLINSATLAAGVGAIPGTNPATASTAVSRCGDLSIVKTAPSSVVAGSTIDYLIKLRNNGPSDIAGGTNPGTITIMDTLPAQVLTLVSARAGTGEAGAFTCTPAGPLTPAGGVKVTCVNAAGTAGDFPVGAMTTIVLKVVISSNAVPGTNIENCAMISAPPAGPITVPASQFDLNPSNNTSCASFVVTSSADLAVSKSSLPVIDPDGAGPLAPVPLPVVGPNVPPGSVNAGGYIRYDLPFGNNGPSDAVNVMLTDQVPGNTAFVGALATGGVFVPAVQPPAIPFTFTIQATDTVAPLGPNVSLTCTVNGAPGSQAIYCRPQGNTGLTPSYADGTLPAGYTGQLTFFVKVNESVAGGTIVSNPANITSGLCPNTSVPIFPPVVCGGTDDPNTSNNTTLPTQTVVIASSNLSISKIVQSAVTSASNPNQTGPIGPATPPNGTVTTGTAVLPGTYLTYRITLTNNGPSDVSNIRLTDILPSGLETPPGRVLGVKYVSVTPVLPSGATFTCAPPTGVNPSNNPQGNGGSLVCTAPLLSANAPNNVAAIDVTVFIDPATKANLVDTATFDATINNVNRPVSGSTTLTTPVAPTSDLALTKTLTNAAGVVGGPVTAGTSGNLYNITVTNNGPSAAQMFNLVDTLPPFQKITNIQVGRLDGNGQFVTPNAKDGNGNPNVICTATPPVGSAGNTTSVTCTASELPPNKNPDGTVNPAGTFIVRLTFTQDAFTTQPTPISYQNCVTATSMSTDPVPANNTNICIPVPIAFAADLSGTKTAVPDPVIAGNLLTFTITANNAGPSAAFNLMITDPLPVGTVFVSAAASAGATLMTPAVGTNGIVKATWDAAGGTPGGLTGPGVVRTLTIVVRVCADFQQIRNLTDAQMCVPNMLNTATISSDTTDPNPNNNTASFTSTVQAQSDLSISKKVAPDPVQYSTTSTPSNVTYTITFANAGPSNANGVTITDVLPKGFTVVSTSSTVPGTTFNITTASTAITTVVANLGVLGAANQCQLNRPTSGTITIVARVPIKHPTIVVTNTATIASTNCLPEPGTLAVQTNPLSGQPAIITPGTGMLANNRDFADLRVVPPGTTPGIAYPALSEASDIKEGSVLFYPIYTSDATNSNSQNTRINITNTSGTEKATVHLFAVDGASCAVLDAFLCLTPNQTSSFLASDFDPGNTGYLIAVAVDDNNGIPRAFNELIGDEFVKFSSGHQANLGAESIASSMMFPAGPNPNATTATLRFDGMNYNRLPRILAANGIGSRSEGNSTMLIVNRIGGDMTTSGALIGNLNGQLFDDTENGFSFTANIASCQLRRILDNTFPRTFTPFDRVLPAGRTGWMKFWTVNDGALLGAQINYNANAGSSAGAFSQGHNLHHLTLSDSVTLVIPVFIPFC